MTTIGTSAFFAQKCRHILVICTLLINMGSDNHDRGFQVRSATGTY